MHSRATFHFCYRPRAKLDVGIWSKLILIWCWLMVITRPAIAKDPGTSNDSMMYSTFRPVTTTEMVYQRFALEPMDQTAVIDSRVTLPCRVLDQKGPIQWTKDDFGLGAIRNLTGYERYAMIGSDEEGRFRHFSPVLRWNPKSVTSPFACHVGRRH